ncbi:MAG: phosphoribosylamine--glycine ligase [Candidatus Diapherotrites archaeon]|nr:phosphoribosylamine--glycine ligase [Candidatus Diapherotrites archaeon]
MAKFDVLVVGGGGREHALVWKIAQSRLVNKVYCAPGNAGIASIAECVPIDAVDIGGLLKFARQKNIGLTVVGPEAPLALGIVNEFKKQGLRIFGPSKAASMLEASKAFAKKIMQEARVPTAKFRLISNIDEAMEFARQNDHAVLKADGLAGGKGVFVCRSKQEIMDAANKLLQERIFGAASNMIIAEELLEGPEVSVIGFCDGKTIRLLYPSQDHKAAFDNDSGSNTGGMGAYAPVPFVSEKLLREVKQKIMQAVVDKMGEKRAPFVGVLYAGLMVVDGEPFVLEFNCRFGDPEAQVILPLLESDIVELMLACVEGKLLEKDVKLKSGAATCVVMASGGYPGSYEKGKEIFGLEDALREKNVVVFHAATKLENGKIVSSGGRVLGVTGFGKNLPDSVTAAYNAVSKVSFEKMHYRNDIGKKALARGGAREWTRTP